LRNTIELKKNLRRKGRRYSSLRVFYSSTLKRIYLIEGYFNRQKGLRMPIIQVKRWKNEYADTLIIEEKMHLAKNKPKQLWKNT